MLNTGIFAHLLCHLAPAVSIIKEVYINAAVTYR